jgi:hypothetical protein
MAQQPIQSYPITIRFIRRPLDELYDDTIRITCENINAPVPRLYKYEFKCLELSRIQNYYFVSEDELLQTLHNAFVMARIDRDPYVSVQVDIPGFPSVILNREDLRQEVLEIIMFNIQTCVRAWPHAMAPAPAPRPQMTALIVRPLVDSGYDSEEEE